MIDWLLIFHITGIVFWIGTLALLTRIQAFAAEQEPGVKDTFALLIDKLFFGGAVPGMLLVLVTGSWMLAMNTGLLNAKEVGPRFHIKLTLVLVLLALTGFVSRADPKTTPAGHFKMLHGVVNLLFLGILAVFFLM